MNFLLKLHTSTPANLLKGVRHVTCTLHPGPWGLALPFTDLPETKAVAITSGENQRLFLVLTGIPGVAMALDAHYLKANAGCTLRPPWLSLSTHCCLVSVDTALTEVLLCSCHTLLETS